MSAASIVVKISLMMEAVGNLSGKSNFDAKISLAPFSLFLYSLPADSLAYSSLSTIRN
jgi:hypothetical protein